MDKDCVIMLINKQMNTFFIKILYLIFLKSQINSTDNLFMGKNKIKYYDSSSFAISRIIDKNEIEIIINNKAKGFDSELVVHLLSRVLITYQEQNRKYQELLDFVEKIRHDKAEENDPVNLVISALSKLDENDQRKILDQNYLLELEKLKNEQHFAQQLQIIITNDINRIKSLLSTLVNNKNIPEHTLNEITKIYDQIKSYKTVRNFS